MSESLGSDRGVDSLNRRAGRRSIRPDLAFRQFASARGGHRPPRRRLAAVAAEPARGSVGAPRSPEVLDKILVSVFVGVSVAVGEAFSDRADNEGCEPDSDEHDGDRDDFALRRAGFMSLYPTVVIVVIAQ